MKKAVILHAMDQTPNGHWYQWLKGQLRERGYEVWVPELPHPEYPDTSEMTEYLLSSDWNFNDNLIIGHSSGAVEVLYLLQSLPANVQIDTAIIVSSFEKMVPGMEKQHSKIFTQKLNFAKLQTKAKRLLFVHGEDDPWCPVSGARSLADQTNGELIVVPKGGHFSTSLDSRYNEFPELIEILESRKII